jgi:5,5'-dehydrodivanillate O-demethylase
LLSAENNRLLTEVGPGTPMGNLLRRYWMPVAGAASLDQEPIKAIRVMGEDLVLYKDGAGTYGLVDRHCPHRRADLSYGMIEPQGIRCSYHGWLMNEHGKVTEQPYEDLTNPAAAKLKERCRMKAYPVREVAGLLFAYLGPAPVPELPVWEPFTWSNGFREVVTAKVPCNWLQCQENSCDPVHFEWMHDTWGQRLRGNNVTAPRHLKLAFEEFEYGFLYKRVREGADESNPLWTIGRVALWPIGFFLGQHFEWRVPVDDENTLSISWFYYRTPTDHEPYEQNKVPAWESPIADENGRWITSHVINQDIVAWVGQGRVADRTKEVLGASDLGISLMRKRYFDDLKAIADGNDPKGIIRDPAAARFVQLPIAYRDLIVKGLPLKDMQEHPLTKGRLVGNAHHAGQPPEVHRAFRQAMGLSHADPVH